MIASNVVTKLTFLKKDRSISILLSRTSLRNQLSEGLKEASSDKRRLDQMLKCYNNE